jgi:hypothetical protein
MVLSSVAITTSVATIFAFSRFFASMIRIEQVKRQGKERAEGKGVGGKRQRHGPSSTGGINFLQVSCFHS